MILKSYRYNMKSLLESKNSVIIFFALMIFVCINFCFNVRHNINILYITEMYDPIKVLTLSSWSRVGYIMFIYLPFLFVIPTSLSYIKDVSTRSKIYIESRCGKKAYWIGKAMAVFSTTFILFFIPFFTEVILSVVSFDFGSHGDPSGVNYIDMLDHNTKFAFMNIYYTNRILYAVLFIVVFSAIAGVLALFNFSITTLPFMKYKIFTFLPLYLLFYLISVISKYLKLNYETNYLFILRMFDDTPKNYFVYAVFIGILFIVSVVNLLYGYRRDEVL